MQIVKASSIFTSVRDDLNLEDGNQFVYQKNRQDKTPLLLQTKGQTKIPINYLVWDNLYDAPE